MEELGLCVPFRCTVQYLYLDISGNSSFNLVQVFEFFPEPIWTSQRPINVFWNNRDIVAVVWEKQVEELVDFLTIHHFKVYLLVYNWLKLN